MVSELDASQHEELRRAVEQRLVEDLGVRIGCEVARPGELDAWTEINISPKLKRFRDER